MTHSEKKTEDFKMVGDWKKQSKQLKAQHPQLIDGDLIYEKGKVNDLLKRIETRLHKNRGEVTKMIEDLQFVKGSRSAFEQENI